MPTSKPVQSHRSSQDEVITLSVNGRDTSVPRGCSVLGLLEISGLAARPCAVERNGRVVPKAQHASTELDTGDRVELVTLVGGG